MKLAVLLTIVPGAFLLAYIFGAADCVTATSNYHALRAFLVERIIISGISIASIELTVFALLWHLFMLRKEVALR